MSREDARELVVDVLAELESMGVGEAGEALIDHVASGHEYDDAIYAVMRASGQLYRQLPEVLESRFDVTERSDIVRRWRREIPWNELTEGHPWIAQASAQRRSSTTSVSLVGRCATLKHMSEVGIRALKQNASAVVAEAAAGKTVTITDRGRAVARMSAIPKSRLRALIEEGHARPARGRLIDLPAPEPGPDLSGALGEMRDDERY